MREWGIACVAVVQIHTGGAASSADCTWRRLRTVATFLNSVSEAPAFICIEAAKTIAASRLLSDLAASSP
jgi:hypothetical protein